MTATDDSPTQPKGGSGSTRPQTGSAQPSPSAASTSGQGRQAQRPAKPARRTPYLIARVPGLPIPGLDSVDLDAVHDALEADPDVTVCRRITPRGVVATLALGAPGNAEIIVAEMAPERAWALGRHPQLIVEEDTVLGPAAVAGPLTRDPGVLVPPAAPIPVPVVVRDEDDKPVAGALVYVYGNHLPGQALTDAGGAADVDVYDETPAAIRGVYVKPRSGAWDRWVPNPAIEPDSPLVIRLEGFDTRLPGFPDREAAGWGLTAMGVDRLPRVLRGRGAKIALVDSGAAIGTHPDLSNRPGATTGFDLLADSDRSFTEDPTGHGTHCLGVIAGEAGTSGIRGIAPEADVAVLKVMPGGRLSTLIEALDRCIEEQVDVVNLSLGCEQPSFLVEQRLVLARHLGVAVVAAAGDTGGPVGYPASSPNVLAVAAVGRFGEFPPDSYHAGEPAPGLPVTPDGLFAARFSAHGPEVGLCAPGVAVMSCVPPGGYAAWDGTSMAAAHVTGLAALVTAHHPDLRGPFRVRNAARVDRLFQILCWSATPVFLGDPGRTGAGLPNAPRALGAVLAGFAEPAYRAGNGNGNGNGNSGGQGGGDPAGSPFGPGSGPASILAQPLQPLAAVMRQAGLLA